MYENMIYDRSKKLFLDIKLLPTHKLKSLSATCQLIIENDNWWFTKLYAELALAACKSELQVRSKK